MAPQAAAAGAGQVRSCKCKRMRVKPTCCASGDDVTGQAGGCWGGRMRGVW